MPKSVTTHINERKHVIHLDHKEVELAIAFAAADYAGQYRAINLKAPGVSYAVKFEDVTEGGPAYKVGTKAIVTIVEDLSPQDKGNDDDAK